MNPFDALGNFAVNLIKHGAVQAWMKLLVSCLVSSVVAFAGFFGSVLLSTKSFVLAIGSGSLAVSITLVSLWIKSPLTKGIPILYFGEIEVARIEEMQKSFEVYDENKK